jgi:hypothetical protein
MSLGYRREAWMTHQSIGRQWMSSSQARSRGTTWTRTSKSIRKARLCDLGLSFRGTESTRESSDAMSGFGQNSVKLYIGGATPSRPTLTAGASSVPSGFFSAAAIKILAPGLSSLLSPGT